MRKKIVVSAADATPDAGAEAVELTFAGATYRWQLPPDEAAQLRTLIDDWVNERPVGGRRRLILRLDGGEPMSVWVTAVQERRFRKELEPWLLRAQRLRRRVVVQSPVV